MAIRVCIDIGGTFTDFAAINSDDGILNTFKTSSVPEDYISAGIKGFEMIADYYNLTMQQCLEACSSENGGAIIFGTTIATNALIEKKVAKVGLICTKGHRDILTFREGGREDPFLWEIDYPDPFIPRYLTKTITERINAEGEEVVPLDEEEVSLVIRDFKKYNVDVIAVSLLWSFINPTHELRIGDIIKKEFPDQRFVLSHSVNPIIREYRRTISTAINASLIPVYEKNLKDFDKRLKGRGYEGNLSLISSFGGILSVKDMIAKPIYGVDAGPAGAPVAGRLYSRKECNRHDVVTCDMGGTSFDVSRVSNGVVETTQDGKIGIDFLGIRKVDTRSIGAGGGSIARVDSGKLLHVGPQSAGANPGPSCYNRGGTLPTVTDANLLLGYINPKYLLGGKMEIDKQLSHEALLKHVALPLEIGVEEAAFSIWNTVCVNMNDAIKTITSWEGIDPKDYIAVAGGGAAGLHIIPMLSELGFNKIVIPKAAGVLSAVGGLTGDMVAYFEKTFDCNSYEFDLVAVNSILESLREQAISFLESNKIPSEYQILEFYVDARYNSQPWELTIPLRNSAFNNSVDVTQSVEDFHIYHERLRGSREEGQYIEFHNWMVKAIGVTRDVSFQVKKTGKQKPADYTKLESRKAFFKELGGYINTNIYDGDKLETGNIIASPAIIEEMSTTIVVFPGSEVAVSEMGNYIVTIKR